MKEWDTRLERLSPEQLEQLEAAMTKVFNACQKGGSNLSSDDDVVGDFSQLEGAVQPNIVLIDGEEAEIVVGGPAEDPSNENESIGG